MITYASRFHLESRGAEADAALWTQAALWLWGAALCSLPDDASDCVDESRFLSEIFSDSGSLQIPGGSIIRWARTSGAKTIEGFSPDLSVQGRFRRRSFSFGDRAAYGTRVWIIEQIEDSTVANAHIVPHVRQPLILRDLLFNWPLQAKERLGRHYRGDVSELATLCKRIEAPDRVHDIIVLSPSRDGRFATNPEVAAKTLTGIAEVWSLPDTWVAKDVLGAEWTPHSGAVFIFHPSGTRLRGSYDSSSGYAITRIFPNEAEEILRKRGNLETRLLYLSSSHRNKRIFDDVPTIDSLQAAFLQDKIRAFRGGTTQTDSSVSDETKVTLLTEKLREVTELCEIAISTNTSLQDELRSARQDALSAASATDAARKECARLSQELGNLRGAFQVRKDGDGDESDTDSPESWEDILGLVDGQLAGRLVFTKNGVKSLHESPYTNKQAVWEALLLLSGPLLSSSRGNAVDLDAAFLNTGWVYNPHVSQTSANLFSQEYTGQYNGRSMDFHKHLKRGTSHDPKRCFRIHFTYDKTDDIIVINHAGRHPRNTKS